MTTIADLVLDNGELVRLECKDSDQDEFYESIGDCLKRRDWWSPERFVGCKATYLGHYLDRVNMARVIGMM